MDTMHTLDDTRSSDAGLDNGRDTTLDTILDTSDANTGSTTDTVGSRRRFVRTALGAALGAAGAAAISSGPAAASVGNMQYGAANNAGTDLTSLTAQRANAPVLTITNTGGNGQGISITSNNAAINASGDSIGGQFAASAAGSYGVIGTAQGANGYGGSFSGQNGYGVKAYGFRSALLLTGSPSGPFVGPVEHLPGEVHSEALGQVQERVRLWACVERGTPGTWRVIASTDSAGAFHAIVPHRVYDSRWGDGPLASGSNRVVPVKDGRALTGEVDVTDMIPTGATAVAYNITVTDTAGSGFLSITPGTETTYAAAAVNWWTSGISIGNASVVPVDANREVRVFAGGGGSTQFVLDLVGYYR